MAREPEQGRGEAMRVMGEGARRTLVELVEAGREDRGVAGRVLIMLTGQVVHQAPVAEFPEDHDAKRRYLGV